MNVQHIGAGDSQTYLEALHGHASFEVAAKYGNDLMLIGTYNNAQAAAQAAEPHNAKANALYVTCNRLGKWATNPTKLSNRRRANESDYTQRRYAYIDIDPVRAAGTSATDQEHTTALKRADSVISWLSNRGWPDPAIYGDSGNGASLLYRLGRNIDSNLYKRAHSALCDTFTDATVEIDPTVTDLARLTPLFGTTKAKGIATTDRPHRTTNAEINTDAGEVTADLLATLAELYKPQAQPTTRGLVTFGELQLPQAAIDFINAPPPEGQRNRSLFIAARAMRDSGLPEAMAHSVLTPVALATGLTEREITSTITSTYKNVKAPTASAALATIGAWERSITERAWYGRTGATDYKTAMAMAAIAHRTCKTEVTASCREVAELAGTGHRTAAASLKRHCYSYHTLRCTNRKTRDTGAPKRYKLLTQGVTEMDTFVEVRMDTPKPPPSTNVSISVTPHDAATLRAGGGTLVQVITALLAHEALNISQLSRLTGRNRESIKRALTLLQNAKGATKSGNTWSLTATDQTGILSVLDRIALATKATGRNEKRRAQHKAQRAEFNQVSVWADDPTSVVDRIRGKRIKLQREAIARSKVRREREREQFKHSRKENE